MRGTLASTVPARSLTRIGGVSPHHADADGVHALFRIPNPHSRIPALRNPESRITNPGSQSPHALCRLGLQLGKSVAGAVDGVQQLPLERLVNHLAQVVQVAAQGV